jgi:hypothetical protein
MTSVVRHCRTVDAVPKIGERLDALNVAFNDIGGDLAAAVEGGRPLMKSLHVGGNTRMSGDITAVLASVPNVEHLDIAGTVMTAASSAAAAAAITSAAHLTNYHVGGAAFVPVLGDVKNAAAAAAALVDTLEVVVTFRESIKFFCGGCPDTVLHMSGSSDCGKSMCAQQLRLRALDCAVAHAVNAAAAAGSNADTESNLISAADVSRESIVPYASARVHAGRARQNNSLCDATSFYRPSRVIIPSFRDSNAILHLVSGPVSKLWYQSPFEQSEPSKATIRLADNPLIRPGCDP